MTPEDLTCAGCESWCRGAPVLATALRRAVPTDDLGTCQKYPPAVVVSAGLVMTLYPETHGARAGCDDWQPTVDFTDDGEREPVPTASIVSLRSVA